MGTKTRQQVLYLAGAIAGNERYREEFGVAQALLEEMGYIVLSPAVLPEGMDRRQYMRICMAMIDSADCVCMLESWMRSLGANLEFDYCDYTGRQIAFLEMENGEFVLNVRA